MKSYPDYMEEEEMRMQRVLFSLDDAEFESHTIDELVEKYGTEKYKKWYRENKKRKEEARKKGIIIN